MASEGNIELNKGIPNIGDAFVVIVKTEWNAHIANALEEGVIAVFRQQGTRYKTIIVPGAVEIAFAVKTYAASKEEKADAFITLGTVIKGGTPHFEYVCKAVTEGVVWLNMNLEVPTIFGVLTVNTEQQALERIGGKEGHKGKEAAVTALKMIALQRSLLH
ncbi:MAG: 6,7-dimethyl-8-ribityllumazine synthase [Bacteroidota bacterium]|nr:6,7-dimethyl-8-ribityllumazine synthase [Bacteroidota bacterium]